MAKTRTTKPVEHPNRWDRSHGTYLTGQAAIDGADLVAIEAEKFWGPGRLRLLVSNELREKFDRQRYKYAQAIQTGELEDVVRESARMVTAYTALDRAARDAGHGPPSAEIWETVLLDGTVVAIARDEHAAKAYRNHDNRRKLVYTLAEVGQLLSTFKAVAEAKKFFPGATVERVRLSFGDPLDRIDQPSGFETPLGGDDGDPIPF